MSRCIEEKTLDSEVLVFLYFGVFSSFWVLAVNPFYWARPATFPWLITGLLGSVIMLMVLRCWRRHWKQVFLLLIVALGASLLYGTTVLFPPWELFLHSGQLDILAPVRLFAPLVLLSTLFLAITFPRATLTAIAVVFSCVGPAIVLFMQPELTFGLGKIIQYSNAEMALFPGVGLAVLSVSWAARLMPFPLIVILVISNVCTFIFIVPLVNSLIAGIFSLLTAGLIVLKKRPERLGRLWATILAALPLVSIAVYASPTLRRIVSRPFGKDESFSGRQQIWEDNLRVVFSDPFKLRIPLIEVPMRESHSFYVGALLMGGLILGTVIACALVIATYWTARNKAVYAPLMVWICMYGVAGSVSFDIGGLGFWLWILIGISLGSQSKVLTRTNKVTRDGSLFEGLKSVNKGNVDTIE